MIVSSSASSGFLEGSGDGDSPDPTKKRHRQSAYRQREIKRRTRQSTFFYPQPLLLQELGNCHPLFRVPRQTLLHACDYVWRHASFKVVKLLRWAPGAPRADRRGRIFRKLDSICGVRDRLHFLVNGEVLEWWVTVDHLIENASERPYIAWPADFEAPHAIGKLDRFWRHVVHGTDLSAKKSLQSAKEQPRRVPCESEPDDLAECWWYRWQWHLRSQSQSISVGLGRGQNLPA